MNDALPIPPALAAHRQKQVALVKKADELRKARNSQAMNAPDSFTLAQFGAKSFATPLAADASSLGYPPGVWPSRVFIDGKQFSDVQPVNIGGELKACDYTSSDGFNARIYND